MGSEENMENQETNQDKSQNRLNQKEKDVLEIIAEKQPVRQKKISKEMVLIPDNFNKLMKNLESDGFVELKDNKQYILTDAGKQAISTRTLPEVTN